MPKIIVKSADADTSVTMDNHPLFAGDIADFLQNEFVTYRYPASEQGGVFRFSERPVRRVGLALEPWSGLPNWVADHQLDALWLHRPWHVDLTALPPDIGILSHHLPFDEILTMSYNQKMAEQLGAVVGLDELGFKQDRNEKSELLPERPIGMLFDVVEQEFDVFLQQVKTTFGGYDRAEAGRILNEQYSPVCRVAVVGAMNDDLIHEAVRRHANVYVTSQYRKAAQASVDKTGIAVIAVGHRRSEVWGVRLLANLLHNRWQDLEIVVLNER